MRSGVIAFGSGGRVIAQRRRKKRKAGTGHPPSHPLAASRSGRRRKKRRNKGNLRCYCASPPPPSSSPAFIFFERRRGIGASGLLQRQPVVGGSKLCRPAAYDFHYKAEEGHTKVKGARNKRGPGIIVGVTFFFFFALSGDDARPAVTRSSGIT